MGAPGLERSSQSTVSTLRGITGVCTASTRASSLAPIRTKFEIVSIAPFDDIESEFAAAWTLTPLELAEP